MGDVAGAECEVAGEDEEEDDEDEEEEEDEEEITLGADELLGGSSLYNTFLGVGSESAGGGRERDVVSQLLCLRDTYTDLLF